MRKAIPDLATVNLNGLLAYPSFFNAHDTLLASYYPFVPKNNPSFGLKRRKSLYKLADLGYMTSKPLLYLTSA